MLRKATYGVITNVVVMVFTYSKVKEINIYLKMKLLVVTILFVFQAAYGQTLSRDHHFDKIGWTMTLPPDFYITTPGKTKDNSNEKYITHENYKNKFGENLLIFQRRSTMASFNYYNFKEENLRITNKNLNSGFEKIQATHIAASIANGFKILDSVRTTQTFDGVLFYELTMNVSLNGDPRHLIFLGGFRKGYYIEINIGYKNESGEADVFNMLKNSKFDKSE